MKYVISFDISDDKKRRQAVKSCLAVGFRVQKSVFEGFLDHGELDELRASLEEIIDPETDSVRFYPLDKRMEASIEIMGCGKKIEEARYKIL
jgi:CRISPR-associated protein Cas2